MKKTLIAAVAAMSIMQAGAVPADRRPYQVTQPDGTSLTLVLNGDEFYHFTTTTDGYTVAQDEAGWYTYQYNAGGRLASTGVAAHDAVARPVSELSLLTTLGINWQERRD